MAGRRRCSLKIEPAAANEIAIGLDTLNSSVLQGAVERAREFGALLSVDDFGMGYSSLAYLKRCLIDTLNIHPNGHCTGAVRSAALTVLLQLRFRYFSAVIDFSCHCATLQPYARLGTLDPRRILNTAAASANLSA